MPRGACAECRGPDGVHASTHRRHRARAPAARRRLALWTHIGRHEGACARASPMGRGRSRRGRRAVRLAQRRRARNVLATARGWLAASEGGARARSRAVRTCRARGKHPRGSRSASLALVPHLDQRNDRPVGDDGAPRPPPLRSERARSIVGARDATRRVYRRSVLVNREERVLQWLSRRRAFVAPALALILLAGGGILRW